jgi:hypothetical protein
VIPTSSSGSGSKVAVAQSKIRAIKRVVKQLPVEMLK